MVNLRDLRLTAGITQSKVANYIGVTFQQVQKYEKGTNGLSIREIFRFCNLFKYQGNVLLEKAFNFKHDND